MEGLTCTEALPLVMAAVSQHKVMLVIQNAVAAGVEIHDATPYKNGPSVWSQD